MTQFRLNWFEIQNIIHFLRQICNKAKIKNTVHSNSKNEQFYLCMLQYSSTHHIITNLQRLEK